MKKEKRVSRFVVYPQKVNRTPAGIHERYVAFHDDMAFVYSYDSRSADIVPRANVFDKLEDAKLYFSGLGEVKWIVMSMTFKDRHSRWEEVPVMFQGRVAFRINTSRYASKRFETIVQDMNGKLFENVPFNTSYFDTKKQAESAYAHLWRAEYKKASQESKDWEKRRRDLIRCKPRSRRKLSVDQLSHRRIRRNRAAMIKEQAKKAADQTEKKNGDRSHARLGPEGS
jgi:hypothetical protein